MIHRRSRHLSSPQESYAKLSEGPLKTTDTLHKRSGILSALSFL